MSKVTQSCSSNTLKTYKPTYSIILKMQNFFRNKYIPYDTIYNISQKYLT